MPQGPSPEPSAAECAGEPSTHGWIRDDGRRIWSALDDGSHAARERIASLVQTLEQNVIPRLVQFHRGPDGAAPLAVHPDEVEQFVALVIEGSEPQIADAVDGLRRRGVAVESLFLDLFAPTARRLGEMWTDDRCDFSTVTVGLGRLQRLLRELSPAFGSEVEIPPNGRRILLTQPEDEHHSFGLAMVAEFFRRSGWAVDGGPAGSGTDPAAAVRRDWYDVVGFSVGSDRRIDWVAARIAELRRASRNSAVIVLVGGPLFTVHPEWSDRVGADAMVTDGGRGPDTAESLISTRMRSSTGSVRPE